MILGAHVSIAGGPANAFAHAAAMQADAIQVFVKPPRRLKGIKPFTAEQIAAWEQARAASPVRAVVVHANYLINLAGDEHTRAYSREALLDEMKRCHELGIGTLVFHPGQHQGAGVDKGLARIAEGVRWCLDQGRDYADVTVCLENMAGQGTMLGWEFGQLADVIDLVGQPERLGVCLDTCHAFAAGYDLRTPEGYAKALEELDLAVGLGKVKAFHLNDSKQELGSRVDRHEEIGKGKLGPGAFKLLLQDPRWKDVPGALETPHEDDKGFAKDLQRLRRLEQQPFTDKDLPRQRALRLP